MADLECDSDVPPPIKPKRGPKPDPRYAAFDLEALADLKARNYPSTLEAARAYLPRFYPDQCKTWSNERLNFTIKNIRRRFDLMLTKQHP